MKRIWKEKEINNHRYTDNTDGTDLVRWLLALRGIDSASADKFLNPDYDKLYDPFLLVDMEKAVERIEKGVQKNEKITVYADYDADAVSAAAVLLRFFRQVGLANVDYYIPDRFSEGYGVNIEAIEKLVEQGTKLIITVDCGINAFEAADRANELGVDVIVTDHHQLTGKLPDAVAVVNPHRPDDRYPFKDLTGVGVAFKLVQALVEVIASDPELVEGERGNLNEIASFSVRRGGRSPRNDSVGRGWEKWLLDLVAVGAVADCQSLLGENRIFVKWGMYVMQKTKWVGLRKLIDTAGLTGQEFDTYKIGFIIAPCINAAGRIEHANIALELLLTDDPEKAQTLAAKLDELNRHRQELTEQILSEAREQIEQIKDRKVLMAAGENWPQGVVGLVAGKLTEEFYRPVLVLSKNGQQAIGSARSIAKFNIVEAIGSSGEILLRYGGHAQAAGFTLHPDKIELLHKNLLTYAEEMLSDEDMSPVLYYDAEIRLAEITPELVDTLGKFEPFGVGNPRPRFRINDLTAKFVKKIGSDEKHLRMYVSSLVSPPALKGGDKEGVGSNQTSFPCIGFNLGFWADKLKQGEKIDIICEPQWNEWNGERKMQLKLIDLNRRGPEKEGNP